MPKVNVILSPGFWDEKIAENKQIVVIDIFRATSTICAALHYGATSVLPVIDASNTMLYAKKNYITAGEREGKTLPGFDFGNSPVLIQDPKILGKKIALTTTNGTKCLSLAKNAAKSKIFSGSFLNIAATARILSKNYDDVILFCSGWKNEFNLEDTLYAGALVNLLSKDFEIESDAAFMAANLYQNAAKIGLEKFITNSSHFKRLSKYDAEGDIKLCLSKDICHKVVVLENDELVLLKE